MTARTALMPLPAAPCLRSSSGRETSETAPVSTFSHPLLLREWTGRPAAASRTLSMTVGCFPH